MSLDRRTFLGSALGTFAAAASGASIWAKDNSAKKSNIATDPETLFLTWQRDPTTTMTIQWVGLAVQGKALAVEFALHQGKPEKDQTPDIRWNSVACQQRAYPRDDLRVFRAELTGLQPGTEYQFRLAKEAAPLRFRTAPAKATDTFKFISGGDCGANDHVINNNILAAQQDPMFALIDGDLAYDNGFNVDANLAFLRNYGRHMRDREGRLIPMVPGIGNHEVKGGYLRPRSDGPLFFALFDGLYAETTYATLDFGDYLSLVLLDSGHVAPIDGEQTAWLNGALKDRVERPHLIVANHVPAYPSYRGVESSLLTAGTGELNRKHWVPLFERHNVDVVLEHHDHTFKRTHPLIGHAPDPNGIVYLGDGSWGKLRPPKAPESRPYLMTAQESYHLSLHCLEGEQRFHLALAEGGRVVDVCMTRKRARI